MKKKVALIILNYNSEKETIKCLEALLQNDYKEWGLIVGDNDSPNKNFLAVEEYLARSPFAQSLLFCESVRNEKNFGFARGINLLIKRAIAFNPEFFLLLNPDTIVRSDFLSKLMQAAENSPEFSIFSPLIKDRQGKIWFSGGEIRWLRQRVVHRTDYPVEKIRETVFVSGCAMLVKRDVFEKVGLLDKDFFLYYEDADFCWRAKTKKFRAGVVKDSVIAHHESSSVESEIKLHNLVLSGLIFFQKNSPSALKTFFWPIFWLRYLKARLASVLKPKKRKAGIITEALKNFYDNHGSNC